MDIKVHLLILLLPLQVRNKYNNNKRWQPRKWWWCSRSRQSRRVKWLWQQTMQPVQVQVACKILKKVSSATKELTYPPHKHTSCTWEGIMRLVRPPQLLRHSNNKCSSTSNSIMSKKGVQIYYQACSNLNSHVLTIQTMAPHLASEVTIWGLKRVHRPFLQLQRHTTILKGPKVTMCQLLGEWQQNITLK